MSLRTLARRLTLTTVAVAVAVSTGGVAQANPAATQPLAKWPRSTVKDGSLQKQDNEENLGSELRGRTMNNNQILTSANGQHVLTVNGYLGGQYGMVLTGFTGDPTPLTTTGQPENSQPANELAMQSDGNLVLYTNGRASWSSGTFNNPGAKLALQNDRNLVVYASNGRVLWASNTVMQSATSYFLDNTNYEAGYLDPTWFLQSGDRRYGLYMQRDGNLVEYSPRGTPLWQSGTGGNPGAYAVLQPDGNFVIYNAAGNKPLWSSGSSRSVVGASLLVVQGDGNVVLYYIGQGVQQVRWTTNTGGRV